MGETIDVKAENSQVAINRSQINIKKKSYNKGFLTGFIIGIISSVIGSFIYNEFLVGIF